MPNYLIQEYTTTVDYSSPVGNLISNYGYTLTNHTYTERGFKTNDTRNSGIVELEMVIIKFLVPVAHESEATNVQNQFGLRSATLKELMALGSQNTTPPIYNLNNIISLNRVKNPFGGQWGYPQLFSPRHLGIIWTLSGSVTEWRFAAVKH